MSVCHAHKHRNFHLTEFSLRNADSGAALNLHLLSGDRFWWTEAVRCVLCISRVHSSDPVQQRQLEAERRQREERLQSAENGRYECSFMQLTTLPSCGFKVYRSCAYTHSEQGYHFCSLPLY